MVGHVRVLHTFLPPAPGSLHFLPFAMRPRASSVPRRRSLPTWDSTKSDLSIHRATRPDIERRKAKTRSHNANQARAELDERQQRMAVGDFSQVYEALEATTPSDRNRPLDYDSPRTAERPKHSDASMHVESVHAQLDALGQPVELFASELFAAEGAGPLPPPNLAGRACGASGDPVVDLDREIELFKLRAGARLQGVAIAPPAAAAHASVATPPAKPLPEAPPATAAPHRSVESMAPSPSPTPTPQPVADTAASRAPDALGLSRMMRQCGWLEGEMSEYEASRDASVHGDDKGEATTIAELCAPPPPASSALVFGGGQGGGQNVRPAPPATKPRKATAAAPSTGASGRGASYGACNERLVEMVGRLMGHLKRAQAELVEQVRASARTNPNSTPSH